MFNIYLVLLLFLLSSLSFSQDEVATSCKLVIDFQYDQVKDFSYDRAAVSQKDNWGFINPRGEIIVPCKYKEVKSFKNNIGAVKANNEWYLINVFGVVISNEGYEEVDYSGNLIKAKKHGKWGALDFHMQPVIPFVHNELIFRGDQFILTENETNLVGIINFKGDTVIPPKYKAITITDHGFLCITNEYAGAFFSEKGEQLTAFNIGAYGNEQFVNDKIILTRGKDEKVILDSNFNIIADGFEYLAHGHGNLVTATLNKKSGIYNIVTKSWLIKPTYNWLSYHINEHWIFGIYEDGMRYGIINESDQIVVEPKSAVIPQAFGQIIILSNNEKKAFHSLESGYQSNFEFLEILASDDGRIVLAKQNGSWSVYNSNGEQIATELLAEYQPLISQNLIAFQNNQGKWGFFKFN